MKQIHYDGLVAKNVILPSLNSKKNFKFFHTTILFITLVYVSVFVCTKHKAKYYDCTFKYLYS